MTHPALDGAGEPAANATVRSEWHARQTALRALDLAEADLRYAESALAAEREKVKRLREPLVMLDRWLTAAESDEMKFIHIGCFSPGAKKIRAALAEVPA